MSLILVIEPDGHHAAQVASMARKHLHAEIVLAESASHAIGSLAGRIPDVLLMSPLLSRQDEGTLAAWLRDLGPAAAHVQELTIPILASSAAPAPIQKRGVLSALRRSRGGSSAPDGCGLDLFARQIATYIELAAAQRKVVDAPPPSVVEAEHPLAVEGELPLEVEAELPLEVVPVEAAAPVEGIVEEDDAWVSISLDDACREPLAAPERVWMLTPIDFAEELTAAPAPPAPEPAVKNEPEPKKEPEAKREPEAKKRARKATKKPPQDEWGFFDPEQCGFAALVAKLDEVTELKDADYTSAETTVRLIAY